MGLKIEIRQHQHKDKNGNNLIVQCTGGIATYVTGNVPDSNWHDITADCENLDNLELAEQVSPDGSFKERTSGSATQIVMGFDAYAMVTNWLLATPCSFLNYFDVRITDVELNYVYKLYELKPDNIELCEDDGCKITVPLKEMDGIKSITDKISIHDNWQGWFGGGAKQFPCMQVFKHLTSFSKAYIIGAWAVIKAILAPIRTFLNIIGVDLYSFVNIDRLKNQAVGFGNFLPTPYIRDILQNAMAKINYTISTPFDIGGFAENDVYVYSNGYYKTDYSQYQAQSPSQTFDINNRQIWQLTDFLDELCKLYNCVWQIVGTQLIITPIKDIDNSTVLFTIQKADVVEDCKTFSFKKNPNGTNYEYQKDATDGGSAETINAYNDIVDFDGVSNNAMLQGLTNKKFKFASTSFWGDYFGEDLLQQIGDASKIMLVMIMATLISVAMSFTGGAPAGNVAAGGFLSSSAIVLVVVTAITITGFVLINDEIVSSFSGGFGEGNPHFQGSIRLIGTGSIITPRIIRLDPNSNDGNKKPVKTSASSILPNPYYNTSLNSWQSQFQGYNGAIPDVFNYPLFFDANYLGNMYDTLHEKTDNALFLQQSNEMRTIKVLLCKNYLVATGINDDTTTCIGKLIDYQGIKYKVLEYKINYKNYTITFKLKKVN